MYSRYDIPALRNYQEALDHYNRIVPIRGHAEKRRPLGCRKHHYMHIRRNQEAFECVMYGTSLLVYHPDNTVEVRNMYRSNSTTDFMSSLLGTRLGGGGYFDSSRGWHEPAQEQLADGVHCPSPDGVKWLHMSLWEYSPCSVLVYPQRAHSPYHASTSAGVVTSGIIYGP